MRYFLGNPDTFGMVALPPVSRGATAQLSRSDSSLRLGSGGTAVTRGRDTKIQASLSFDPVDRDADAAWAQVRDLYRGVYGSGPYAFVDPNNTNHLDLSTSLMGARYGVADPWDPSTGGTLAAASAAARVDARAGALLWTPAAGADALLHAGPIEAAGANNGRVPVGARCVPYLPSRRLILSVVVWRAAGPATLTVALRAARRTLPDTGGLGEALGANIAVGSVPTRLSLAIPAATFGPGAFGYVLPGLWLRAPVAGSVLGVTMPQLEYPLTADAPARAWQPGSGVPRMSITSGPRAQMRMHRERDYALTLAEL